MPLQIFIDTISPEAARRVYDSGIGLNGVRRYDAGMGVYAVAHDLVNATALGTSGAGPCVIIVVHKARGWGALGHYSAHDKPGMIVAGVQAMINQLGGLPIAGVVFSAGEIGQFGTQVRYELLIKMQVRGMCPGTPVRWYHPQGLLLSSCYYLPLAEQIGLFSDQPDGFTGEGSQGITKHRYLKADAETQT